MNKNEKGRSAKFHNDLSHEQEQTSLEYIKQVKIDIERLINSNQLNEAKSMLDKYKDVMKNDIDAYSMRAIICFAENNLDEAERLLNEALNIDNNNFDILYNLAFLYQSKEEHDLAVIYYKRALAEAKDEETKEQIKAVLKDDVDEKVANVDLSEITHVRNIDNKIPRFSVVIPTRNSPETLEYTLKTCIDQEFNDYEIVVSDNSNDDRTRIMIERLNCSRIKYVRPEQELAMTDNFNFAVENSTGEYVIVLGSDDGLLFHTLKVLDSFLERFKVNVLRWDMVLYGWPNVKILGSENLFSIPSKINKENVKCLQVNDAIKQVINFEVRFHLLPMLYMNSVVSRKLINVLKEKTGKIFDSASPDVYSGFAFAYLEGTYNTLTMPMSIGGMSSSSNGIANTIKGSNSEHLSEDYNNLNRQFGYNWYDVVPKVRAEEIYVFDSFLYAKKNLFSSDRSLTFNREKFIKRCISSLYCDDDLKKHVNEIDKSLYDKKELQDWFRKNIKNNPGFKGYPPPKYGYSKGFTQDGGLVLDATEFGVKDVYGAAELFRKLTGI